jgi:hypothetical protein
VDLVDDLLDVGAEGEVARQGVEHLDERSLRAQMRVEATASRRRYWPTRSYGWSSRHGAPASRERCRTADVLKRSLDFVQ